MADACLYSGDDTEHCTPCEQVDDGWVRAKPRSSNREVQPGFTFGTATDSDMISVLDLPNPE